MCTRKKGAKGEKKVRRKPFKVLAQPDQVKKLRTSLGLSHKQFALLVGTTAKRVKGWEDGAPTRYSLGWLRDRVSAGLLGVEVYQLYQLRRPITLYQPVVVYQPVILW